MALNLLILRNRKFIENRLGWICFNRISLQRKNLKKFKVLDIGGALGITPK